MYAVLMFLLIGLGLWLAVSGGLVRNLWRIVAGAVLAIGTAVFFWSMGFWGEMLWFESLGYGERFWDVFIVRVLAGSGGLFFSAIYVFLLSIGYSSSKKLFRYAAVVLAGGVGLNWGVTNWEVILRFLYAVPTELRDPVFAKTSGFYLFTLPMLDAGRNLLFLISLIAFGATAADAYLSLDGSHSINVQDRVDEARIGAVYRSVGAVVVVMALSLFLKRYHLMYSDVGPITGPGWTDVNIRLPAILVMIGLLVLTAVMLMVPGLRRLATEKIAGLTRQDDKRHVFLIGTAAVFILVMQALLLIFIPSAFQQFRVEPNEITFERPYISHNIEFTRHGFNLMGVEEREYPAKEQFTRDMVEKNRAIFSNIRLWDYRALDAVFKQFQEIRLYYEFADVDVDRYTIDGEYRQVMVSAREIELDNLPPQSQTFVNRRFKYTHGYGITMTNVSEFTEQGLPDLLIRDIPPQSRHRDITVERPEIYYGELTRDPALVNTREEEFDYPRGEGNAYVRYSGEGGVVISSLWRKFLYGWKYDGMQLLLSGYPTRESRIMFHRQIEERARILAPFLEFDDDPYIVLAEGKLYWILDGYTTSEFYPYSERFVPEGGLSTLGNRQALYSENKLGRFRGSNYVRNSVKVVIDAYNGSVDFYLVDEQDPLIRTWQRIFPDMFKSGMEMPESLRKHIRYPIDMLLLQGLVYAKYHMTDPTVFYNQEDLWVRATEKYYDKVQPVEPYYIMWELPESDHPQFVLMLPFTPKNRQVSIGWIAGMCDGDNYGRFLAYKFPKEKRVLGPQQVETKIDQDRFLSGQLTLWDQRGSRVIRGNVLAIPLEESLFYVEPIYLQAETAAYPELRLVAVMHDDKLSYAESFEKALQGIFGADDTKPAAPLDEQEAGLSATDLIRSANESFTNYLSAMGAKRFQEATDSLARLEALLQQLAGRHGIKDGGQKASTGVKVNNE
jgi:uncharacterized membrane protein (UPF0182 family)